MPHDVNGKVVNVGDIIHIPAKVKAVHQTEDFCNVDVELVHPMPGTGDHTMYSALNTRQVIKQD
jgi:hypothetical protein